MTLTSRKARPLNRKDAFRDARLFVIATEGTNTEREYFESLKTLLKTTRIQIKVLHTEDGNSSPQAVLERLIEYEEKYDLGEEDFLCLVIDKDRWPDKNLSTIASECLRKKYELALSNPCFEVWILGHLSDTQPANKTADDFIEGIKRVLGSYNKSNLNCSSWLSKESAQKAIRNAKLNDDMTERWPSQPGRTRVHKVVEELLNI